MKSIAEDIYETLLRKEISTIEDFIKWCNYTEDMKQQKIGLRKFERLPNVVLVEAMNEETDLVFLIHKIVKKKVLRRINQTEPSDFHYQSLRAIVPQKEHPQKNDIRRKIHNIPVGFCCGRPEYTVCYCRERKVVFDSYRARR
ncbi:CCHC-type domain-containing protein [Nephila pilipes]|uniref:CCHC-type domain-containing protein n=1 Tax=Nephila pilipes TaxID=299642 RepID=A0A8X6MSP7_NEPPI|nr:CCHC-type domain-containing protein [Nephila pilipes]